MKWKWMMNDQIYKTKIIHHFKQLTINVNKMYLLYQICLYFHFQTCVTNNTKLAAYIETQLLHTLLNGNVSDITFHIVWIYSRNAF